MCPHNNLPNFTVCCSNFVCTFQSGNVFYVILELDVGGNDSLRGGGGGGFEQMSAFQK